MTSYQDLLDDLAKARAARHKVWESQEYSIGQGGNARRNRRVQLDQLDASIASIEQRITVHPDNPARCAVRRVRYFRAL